MHAALAGIDPPVKAVSPSPFSVGGTFQGEQKVQGAMNLPWFRLYTEFASDPKIQILAFEDQRHYVMLLCLKGNGTLDTCSDSELYRERLIARGLGLDPASASEAKRRLVEAQLIGSDWQPLKWAERQFRSDCSTPRVLKYREKQKGNVTETFLKRNETVIDQNRSDTEQNKSAKKALPPEKNAEWAEIEAHAKAIGFRPPARAIETPSSYRTAMKQWEITPRSKGGGAPVPLAETSRK